MDLASLFLGRPTDTISLEALRKGLKGLKIVALPIVSKGTIMMHPDDYIYLRQCVKEHTDVKAG